MTTNTIERGNFAVPFMLENTGDPATSITEVIVDTNPESFRLYIEWVAVDVTAATYDPVDPTIELTPEVETLADKAAYADDVTISFFKQVGGTTHYDYFDINPIKLNTETSVPATYIPGGRYKVTVANLPVGVRIVGNFFTRLL